MKTFIIFAIEENQDIKNLLTELYGDQSQLNFKLCFFNTNTDLTQLLNFQPDMIIIDYQKGLFFKNNVQCPYLEPKQQAA